eukprot:TRINITY_DN113382_c0_g1_i1.p1 TRINITY_DN113382_c0_g1~~TRINITY_DN113382_c0_g1_i1.p1  ORF type:complete len:508 (-),score=197.22 TRINITY_DN113382_c0_g1_i1:240-1763(-)
MASPMSASRTQLVAMPMPPEPPALNLGSPRVKAAMRVLGLRAKDLEPIKKDSMPSEVSYEVFERKRRQLAENVRVLASESPEVPAETSGGMSKLEERNANFLAEILAIEQKNIAKMETMAKKDIQSMMIKELEAKLKDQTSKKRQEEANQRQKELIKERDAKLAEAKKIAQKKKEKSDEVRRKADEALLKEAEELSKHLDEKQERSLNKIRENKEAFEAGRDRRQEKGFLALKRKEDLEKTLLERREDQYSKILDRDGLIFDRLANIDAERHNIQSDFAERKAMCTKRAADYLVEKQSKYDEAFFKTEERHATAAQTRAQSHAASLKEFKTKNSKTRQQFENRYNTMKKHEEEERSKPSKRVERYMELLNFENSGCLSRPEYHHMVVTNRSMVDLVKQNRETLQRSHSYHQEQALEKIAGMREKVKIIMDGRHNSMQRRQSMIKNCAIEKHHLSDKVDRIKSSTGSKMTHILEKLEPDPEAATRINELLSAMGMELLPGTKVDDDEK